MGIKMSLSINKQKLDNLTDEIWKSAKMIHNVMAEYVIETKEAVLREHRSDIESLQPLGKLEVAEFLDAIVAAQPDMDEGILSAAIKAAINLEKSRNGKALLEKISRLSEDDVDGLNRLLSDW